MEYVEYVCDGREERLWERRQLDHYIISCSKWQAHSGYSGLRLRHPKKDHHLVTYQLADLGAAQDLALATSKAVKVGPAFQTCCFCISTPSYLFHHSNR